MDRTTRALFSAHSVRVDESSVDGPEDCPLVSKKDLEETALSIKDRISSAQRYTNWCSIIGQISCCPIEHLPERGHFSVLLEGGEACADYQKDKYVCLARPGKCSKCVMSENL